MKRKRLKPLAALVLATMVAGCGGDSGVNSSGNPQTAASILLSDGVDASSANTQSADSTTIARVRTAAKVVAAAVPAAAAAPGTGPLSPASASHFLTQATFGPTAATINALALSSKAGWISAQFNLPQTSHRSYVQGLAASGVAVTHEQVYESFWKQVIMCDDQLRQRVAFALSQIFVISLAEGRIVGHPAGVASYYDMLGKFAFGNFRDLLENVALHPMMGIYLTHLHNTKEEGQSLPDENFAREVMQLMTIGLYQLNQDGSVKTSGGKPIETYTHDDVAGLARVFTGWSWNGPGMSADRFFGADAAVARDWTPMKMYPAYHSTGVKHFLGVSTAVGATGEQDLKVALDALFNHPNVGPFIGRQLIQHLVSSNPSPAYVSRVAAIFNNNGNGVRGDMRAVIRAVLQDAEAEDNGKPKKLREPVLRMANWMRAFGARSTSGRYLMYSQDDTQIDLGQTVLRAPSVFNFFRPQYVPPNSALSAAGMVAPEMQITGEPSVVGYLNFMQAVIKLGVGYNRDLQPNYNSQLVLANTPDQLVDHLALLLLGGSISSTLRNQVIGALNALQLPSASAIGATQIAENIRKSRVQVAILLIMASPEYLAQR